MAGKIKDQDKGFKKFKRAIDALSGKRGTVAVGITQKAGSAKHGRFTISEIATVHEFGIGQIERSWLRGWFDENKAEIQTQIKKAAKAVYEGRITEEQALELLGQKFVGMIKKRISGGGALAPNAPSTIAAKGSSVPLVDEGRLIGSISHEVKIG